MTEDALRQRLRARWPLPGHAEVREQLLDAYAAPDRHYHDLLHLAEVLDRIDELSPVLSTGPSAAGADAQLLAVRLAAWFHDGIYDRQPGAEERSARWAAAALRDVPASPGWPQPAAVSPDAAQPESTPPDSVSSGGSASRSVRSGPSSPDSLSSEGIPSGPASSDLSLSGSLSSAESPSGSGRSDPPPSGSVSSGVAEEVARLVRLTEFHTPGEGDLPGAVLSDADLAILAAGPARYAAYAAAVRAEYARYDDETFARGRVDVLDQLAAAEYLFATDHARTHWESRARHNIAAERRRLTEAQHRFSTSPGRSWVSGNPDRPGESPSSHDRPRDPGDRHPRSV